MTYETHTWLPERFYWIVIEPELAGVGVGGQRSRQLLLESLEPQLPQPVDTIHAVYTRLYDGTVLACVVAIEELQMVPENWVELRPSELPEYLRHLRVDVSELNMLVGDFEPKVFRQSERRRTLTACAAMVICTVLIGIGWLRRESAASKAVIATDHVVVQAASKVLNQEFGSAALAEAGLQEALERANVVASGGQELASFDAALALQSLLEGWQGNADVSVQNLSITQEAVSLNVDARGDSQAFLRSITTPAGWTLDEPRLTTSGETTRIALVFHPPRERGAK